MTIRKFSSFFIALFLSSTTAGLAQTDVKPPDSGAFQGILPRFGSAKPPAAPDPGKKPPEKQKKKHPPKPKPAPSSPLAKCEPFVQELEKEIPGLNCNQELRGFTIKFSEIQESITWGENDRGIETDLGGTELMTRSNCEIPDYEIQIAPGSCGMIPARAKVTSPIPGSAYQRGVVRGIAENPGDPKPPQLMKVVKWDGTTGELDVRAMTDLYCFQLQGRFGTDPKLCEKCLTGQMRVYSTETKLEYVSSKFMVPVVFSVEPPSPPPSIVETETEKSDEPQKTEPAPKDDEKSKPAKEETKEGTAKAAVEKPAGVVGSAQAVSSEAGPTAGAVTPTHACGAIGAGDGLWALLFSIPFWFRRKRKS